MNDKINNALDALEALDQQLEIEGYRDSRVRNDVIDMITKLSKWGEINGVEFRERAQ